MPKAHSPLSRGWIQARLYHLLAPIAALALIAVLNQTRLAQQLEYVGEWHSHPDGCGCKPSDDDFNVFSWIVGGMSPAGVPALMAIVGESDSSLWFLDSMERAGGWELRQH